MALEFALRPRFDLKRPARKRRFSWPRVHPLVLPIGAYWLAAAGLTYALVHSPAADAASASELGASSDEPPRTETPSLEPPLLSPSVVDTAPTDVIQPPARQEPEPLPVAEPRPEEPLRRPDLDQPDLDRASRKVAENRPTPSRQAPPPFAPNEHRAKARALEAAPDLFEELPPRRAEPEREAEAVERPRNDAPTGSLPSCESAAATANQTIAIGSARGAPDLTRGAFASVLEHGGYLAPCSIPPRMAVEICAAVQDGAVVGVTVTTEPRDSAINGCVRRAVTKLRFPRSPQLDVTRTRFERER